MPSGKQILLSVLQDCSQRLCDSQDTNSASEELQAALLLHCSTASETWGKVNKIAWISGATEDGEVYRQGLGLKDSGIFLTDILEAIDEGSGIPESVVAAFPSLSDSDYSDSMFIIWHLLSALQYWEELESVEDGGRLDIDERDRMLGAYIRKNRLYRQNPEDFS